MGALCFKMPPVKTSVEVLMTNVPAEVNMNPAWAVWTFHGVARRSVTLLISALTPPTYENAAEIETDAETPVFASNVPAREIDTDPAAESFRLNEKSAVLAIPYVISVLLAFVILVV